MHFIAQIFSSFPKKWAFSGKLAVLSKALFFQIDNEDVCAAIRSCLFEWLEGFTKDVENDSSTTDMTLMEACIIAYAEHVTFWFGLIFSYPFFKIFLEVAQMPFGSFTFFGQVVSTESCTVQICLIIG